VVENPASVADVIPEGTIAAESRIVNLDEVVALQLRCGGVLLTVGRDARPDRAQDPAKGALRLPVHLHARELAGFDDVVVTLRQPIAPNFVPGLAFFVGCRFLGRAVEETGHRRAHVPGVDRGGIVEVGVIFYPTIGHARQDTVWPQWRS
jgi:hypothetical protein